MKELRKQNKRCDLKKCPGGHASEVRIDLAQVKMPKWVSSQWDLSWRTRNHLQVTPIQPVVKVTGTWKGVFSFSFRLLLLLLLDRWDVVSDASPGTEGAGTQKEEGAPDLAEQRRDYGSRNVFPQPHHAGAYKLAPFESQQSACGVLEQFKPAVSGALSPLVSKLSDAGLCRCTPVLITCLHDGASTFSCSDVLLLFTAKPLNHHWNTPQELYLRNTS